jgi:hypothetical protein
MKKFDHIILVSTISFLMAISIESLAQTNTKRTDAREHIQRARIADGRRDGEVTRREGVALNMEQRHVRRAERRAKADGEVTVEEKRRLERKQNRASRHIRRAKHNDIDNN